MSDTPSVKTTEEFYDKLMRGEESRGILGKDKRFNAMALREKALVKEHFVKPMQGLMGPEMRVLDYGCGPGTFMSLIADFCDEIVGVDISQEFVDTTNDLFKELNIENGKAVKVNDAKMDFPDSSFDMVLMVDTIHHIENIQGNLEEAMRVLKPGGKFVVFEPNKLNPLIHYVHWIDPNEKGLLALGTPGKYRKLLSPFVKNLKMDFNGIVIGPSSKAFDAISYILNTKLLKPIIGWLNPKILIVGEKP